MNLLKQLSEDIKRNLAQQIVDQKQFIAKSESNVCYSLLGQQPVPFTIRQQFTHLSVLKNTLKEMEDMLAKIEESQPASPVNKEEHVHG